MDTRLIAFCSRQLLDCFHSVTHESEIWKRDPYDVESIHTHARHVFESLLSRLQASQEGTGKTWLIKGEAGAGKTHLMRAFRNRLHDAGLGYFSYMQMTAAESHYPRYILKNTLDSLDKPYHDDPTGSETGLMRLSRALAENRQAIAAADLQWLRDAEFTGEGLVDCVFELADRVAGLPRFAGVERELIRTLLFLQRDSDRLKRSAMKFLRCEAMAERDWRLLGMPPLTDDDQPQRLLAGLGQLIWSISGGTLVLCLDQLEYMYRDGDLESAQRFRNAVQAVNGLASRCPRLLVLISCLDDYYAPLRQQLTQSEIDRMECDPEPVTLEAFLAPDAITALISRRLEALYEFCGAEFDPATALYPFPDSLVSALQNMRTRNVLVHCQRLREQSQRTERVPVIDWIDPVSTGKGNGTDALPEDETIAWDQHWNDLFSQSPLAPPDDDAGMQQLLAATIEHCSAEQPYRFTASPIRGGLVVDTLADSQVIAESLIGLCNKSAKGGALAKQITEAAQAAGQRTLVIARSTAFPANPKTQVARQIAELLMCGARRTVIEDSDWRAMAAMRLFRERHAHEAGFDDWLARSQPLSLRPALKTLLGLEHLMVPPPPEPPPPATPLVKAGSPAVATLPREGTEATLIEVGCSRDYVPQPVTLERNDLCRHAAFLGGAGSGKTTLALTIVEQLLLQGIPALLIDRKGDLASYARHAGAAERPGPLAALLAGTEVALYTPGQDQGRPLSIPIIPADLGELSSAEREQTANYAALALGSMMNYKPQGQAKTRLAILARAIALLAELRPDARLGLDELIGFISDDNSDLIYAIGQLDPKHFKKLVEDLETLRLLNGPLFSERGERLDCAALLGRDGRQPPDRTRLTLINTSFLGDNTNVLFWVAQLLLEIGRYARHQPSDRLQCVIMLDEADLYLPANSKPPTKGPLENLLRRARSAGIGLLLATQSPGDLDYRSRDQITTWFLGRIREQTALNKLRPMLSEARSDIEARLPSQEPGRFYMVRERQAVSLKARRSLVQADQLPEDEILALARRRRGSAG